MNVPLNEVMYFDAITSHPTTGAATDADSTPTFAVYEEATDTDIGVGGNLTKRTSLTGNYRGTFTISTANGFEIGKWYNVIVSATVNGVSGKETKKTFRVVAPEVYVCRLVDKKGNQTWYTQSADTDAARGLALVAARDAAVSAGGGKIYIDLPITATITEHIARDAVSWHNKGGKITGINCSVFVDFSGDDTAPYRFQVTGSGSYYMSGSSTDPVIAFYDRNSLTYIEGHELGNLSTGNAVCVSIGGGFHHTKFENYKSIGYDTWLLEGGHYYGEGVNAYAGDNIVEWVDGWGNLHGQASSFYIELTGTARGQNATQGAASASIFDYNGAGGVGVFSCKRLLCQPEENWTKIKGYAIEVGQAITNDARTHLFVCTVAGTSGTGSEPSFNTTLNATTVDGTVTWKCHGPVSTKAVADSVGSASRLIVRCPSIEGQVEAGGANTMVEESIVNTNALSVPSFAVSGDKLVLRSTKAITKSGQHSFAVSSLAPGAKTVRCIGPILYDGTLSTVTIYDMLTRANDVSGNAVAPAAATTLIDGRLTDATDGLEAIRVAAESAADTASTASNQATQAKVAAQSADAKLNENFEAFVASNTGDRSITDLTTPKNLNVTVDG